MDGGVALREEDDTHCGGRPIYLSIGPHNSVRRHCEGFRTGDQEWTEKRLSWLRVGTLKYLPRPFAHRMLRNLMVRGLLCGHVEESAVMDLK